MIDEQLCKQVRALLSAPGPLTVSQVGEPVLRARAGRYDGQLPDELLHVLLDAMLAHLPGVGVGLAAPQIGIPLAIAVIEDPAEVPADIAAARERGPQPLLELINPEFSPIGTDVRVFYEGCLSVRGLTAVVSRHHSVEVSAVDRYGTPCTTRLTGWPARIAQHEIDHLRGVLYLDRAELRSLATLDNYERLWADPTPETAAAALRFGPASFRH